MKNLNFVSKTFLLTIVGLIACGARADEAEIRKAMKDKYPQVKVEKVNKTEFGGLYEVYAQDQIIYTDAKATFLLDGNLIDLKTGTNITAERKSELTRINFNDLPLQLALKVVKGNGKRKMAVFSDPDCPFCRKLETELLKVTDVTIYTFIFPIDSLHPQAREKSKAIWCSPDRLKAWNDYLLNGTTPTASPTCDTPVDKIVEVGEKYRINGTPTIFFANGRKVPGAIPADQLEKMLSAATPSK